MHRGMNAWRNRCMKDWRDECMDALRDRYIVHRGIDDGRMDASREG